MFKRFIDYHKPAVHAGGPPPPGGKGIHLQKQVTPAFLKDYFRDCLLPLPVIKLGADFLKPFWCPKESWDIAGNTASPPSNNTNLVDGCGLIANILWVHCLSTSWFPSLSKPDITMDMYLSSATSPGLTSTGTMAPSTVRAPASDTGNGLGDHIARLLSGITNRCTSPAAGLSYHFDKAEDGSQQIIVADGAFDDTAFHTFCLNGVCLHALFISGVLLFHRVLTATLGVSTPGCVTGMRL